jgi:bacterioferritin B
MVADQPAKLLVAQIASELKAHQVYMGISVHFTRESLNAFAKFFRDQAIEEADHAWKIITYLVDNDIEFALPQVGGAATTYKTAREAMEVAQASERRVTEAFETIANAAREAKDNRTHQFVQWFIEEQVEEERTIASLLDLVDSGINLFDAEAHLERVTRE